MVQLDDLRRLEVRRRQVGESHHQHGADGEVGCDEAVALAEALAELGVVVGVEARGAHHSVHTVLRVPREVLLGRLQHGEVDHDLDAGVLEAVVVRRDHEAGHVEADGLTQVEAGVVGVDGGHELQVGIAHDRLAHGGAHAPGRTEDADLDQGVATVLVSAISVRAASSNGPTRATTRSLPNTRSATRCTSSRVTASVRSTSSLTLSTSPCTSSLRPMRFMRPPESSRARASEPFRWPLARASSWSVTPSCKRRSSSSPIRCSTSSVWLGAVPAYTAIAPLSSYAER